jgi:ribosome-associated protein
MNDTPDESEADEIEPIRLDHFLKSNHISGSGGAAKLLIQNGEVRVNGEVETRRRRKLKVGDVVEFGGNRFTLTE